ncbi:UPF0182 family protein [Streptomyces sp. NPDC059740]|uniref:UPF0182 family membrane protein n=1 Tax=Streptomyces sp. NPDC059740 TaxID=3346926 RepID=UPI00364D8243
MPDRGASPSGPRSRVGRPSRRVRAVLVTLGVLAVLAMLFIMFSGIWTDWLWYRSVRYSSVFTTTLATKLGLFAVFGVIMAVAVGVNVWLAHRLRPPLSAMSVEQQSLDRYRMAVAPHKKWVLLAVTVLIGLVAGASSSGQWRTWLQWVNGVPFGTTDPQFHLDTGFYTFDLPWYRFLLSFGFACVVLCLAAAAITHYLYGGLRLTSPGSRATAAATGHLSVLLGLFVALKAVAYWLDRYGLAVKSSELKNTDNWTGLRYVDANAYLPAKTILFCIAVICALLFFATLWRRTWQLPVIGFGLMVLSAVLIGGLYPWIVQKFEVGPNELSKERPYIQKNIDATRDAYGIAGAKVSDYNGNKEPKTDAERARVRADATSTASIRLLDPNVVSPAFQQQQGLRGYYSFAGPLDVDRYTDKAGQEQDTVIGLRELNPKEIPDHNWINDHFKYTHGYGAVAAKGTDTKSSGDPDYTESDLPTEGAFGPYQQRVYYGEKSTQYSIVGGPQKELDYSNNGDEKSFRYDGKGGVSLDNPLNRAAYAVAFNEPQILYSGAISDKSRIMYNRTPKQRVESVAPWLTIDGDAYPAVVNHRIQWVVDAYTTSDAYPYSSRTTLGDTTADSLTNGQRAVVAQQNQVNYIRNSVKATVDAYDGTVKLYQWDTKDPVLKTWMKAFPGTVEPRSDIGPDLMDHLRYPQDMFKVQRQMLAQYHVTDPDTFYSAGERWQVPADPTKKTGEAVPPYYLSMKMPDQKARTFSLTTTYTPRNTGLLGAYMSVDADASSSDYGTIRILKLPSQTTVPGPQQVQSKFNGDGKIANDLNLLKRGDSEIEYGNLLTIPLDGGLVYVEPVYLRGAGLNYPRLEKVLVSYGDHDPVLADTLDEALNAVFGTDSGGSSDTGTEPPDKQTGGSATTNPSVSKALEDAEKAYDAAEKARIDGDWKAFGDAQKDIKAALDRAAAAQKAAGRSAGKQSPGGSGE